MKQTRHLSRAVRQLFAPSRRPGLIGAEVELIPVSDPSRPGPVDPAALTAGFDPAFVAAARPSFEPGGQLELSPAPRPGPAELVADLGRLIERAEAIARSRGVRLVATGVNPYHGWAEVPLRTPTPRYTAMQAIFDRTGPAGRRMMRLTASLQLAVDLLPGPAGREQWLVANLAGPALTVAFDNSGGERTRIWRALDPVRTGYDGRHLDPADPVAAYLAFAAAAPRLPIPETTDPAYHLTTLFPPVRPRGGYLELRYLDAQPAHRIEAAVRTVATLLTDPGARRDALDLLLPRAGEQDRAWAEAAAGHAPQAAELLAIAGSAIGAGGAR
ncbi:glutamate-cysteine ligase family protein [Microlunatus parietis]|uniref:glutamate--cysteine ligase n=1 Tax=Microlunatus parietis TaxID=682979 RepID=A0A7Y9I4Z2_9ACTN|nr:glutamate-cysteine ligase family protein [Microlunatus parietis]NYE70272.1 glutamate--cysteine ligase [Microlunatus parietis]